MYEAGENKAGWTGEAAGQSTGVLIIPPPLLVRALSLACPDPSFPELTIHSI